VDAALERNLQKWATYCPSGAHVLRKHQFSGKKISEETSEEASNWFKGLDLYNISTLFVYGVGSGKYYRAAKDWLLENPGRRLVFLEDDCDILYRLLQSELGRELIFDDQVWLQFSQWDNVSESNSNLPYFLFLGDIQISCLASYGANKASQYNLLSNDLQYLKNIRVWMVSEHLYLGSGFFKNFYRNILTLPKSYLSDTLFKKFEGVPAIICGGGPSLDKNRAILETLKNRALIFAGGSSMNAVNETGFNPHFGVGIDPNLAQYTRLMMNQAFTVPYFYRARMFAEALDSIHGEHIYVQGAMSYNIASWIEKQLGLEGEKLFEGNNVVNFSLSIAHALGCNPIILVGVDLAYTNLGSYAKGVQGHPIYDLNINLSTKAITDELLIKKDIYGNDTYSLWKWIMESMWYTEYALKNPELKIINATEGGIGFESIPNIPLGEVAETYLKEKYDFDTLVHGEVQNAKMPETVSEVNIIRVIGELARSLAKCDEYCNILFREFEKMILQDSEGEKIPSNIFTDLINLTLEKLHQEIAYTHLLAEFDNSYISVQGKGYMEIDIEELNEQDQHKSLIKKVELNRNRYQFLMTVSNYNRAQINAVLQEKAIRKAVSEMIVGEKAAPTSFPEGDKITGEKQESFYPDGKVKSSLSMRKGEFHGPSVFYSPEGKILAHSNYVEGKKEGEARYFYETGEVHSLQNYLHDQLHGKQEYFYKNGWRKSTLVYKNGLLHGDVILYHTNGKFFRKLTFKEGKREGKESLWNMGGFQEFEAEYKNNLAVGVSRAWYPNGKLAREAIYDEASKLISIKQWDATGTLIPQEQVQEEDYFEIISKQTANLTAALDNLCDQVKKVSQLLPSGLPETGKLNSVLNDEVDNLKLKMEKLHQMEGELLKHSSVKDNEGKELIWKTPTARRIMGKQIEEATKKMSEDIATIQEMLKTTIDLFKNDQTKQKS
jgi:antitoxin component YwqK of YwqJK toxin-antitoxin module